MKRNIFTALVLAFAIIATSASQRHDGVHSDFEKRKAQTAHRNLYDVFSTAMTDAERNAMEFLYAYMPLPDMTDYSGEFYLDNVRCSLLARQEMPWGGTVPETLFRHFVLPVRVNNENLDSCRTVFYHELKDRVKGLSMSEAILEINHWCHEKVTYRPSDSRTSSPLASVRTAYGRCGEESTFTVAALRAMGIPARQVYTPRWAHTDDNHAWVEAWADGSWHFIGACEPEPVLNLGWFNAPASRGMMMNTKVTGAYHGPEEQLGRNECYTEINVTSNYAPTATMEILVVDSDGIPVAGAKAEFKLYNYAELYTIASKLTDSDGKASLTTGLGDMIVWASDGNRFGFAPVSVTAQGTRATITLDKDSHSAGSWEWNLVPPRQSASIPRLSDAQIADNELRKSHEDSIRNAYTATFFSQPESVRFASDSGIADADSADRIARILVASRGNHRTITDFLSENISNPNALPLLEAVSEKDLRDISPETLSDHAATPAIDSPLYAEYILNPRVANEMLTPYRHYLRSAIPLDEQTRFRHSPSEWVKWCADSIAIDTVWNPQRLRMHPASVYRTRLTDTDSRNIFFVAGARSMGIPARIDPVTGKPQYADSDNNWTDADFSASTGVRDTPTGKVRLQYTQAGRLSDPQYYYQFTLSKIDNGSPALLNYPEDATLSATFLPEATLDSGQYLLVTGQRMADGTVLTKAGIFPVEADMAADTRMEIRQDTAGVQVIGTFNSENLYHNIGESAARSILSTTGRGYYILGVLSPNHEPTTHALNDISQFKDDFEAWGGKILLLFDDMPSASRFNASQFPGLPETVTFGTDIDSNIIRDICANMDLDTKDHPVFIIADTFNRIVYISQGYNIGLGDRLIDILHKIGR